MVIVNSELATAEAAAVIVVVYLTTLSMAHTMQGLDGGCDGTNNNYLLD
jgi:hypothetical protein